MKKTSMKNDLDQSKYCPSSGGDKATPGQPVRSGNQSRRLLITAAIATPAIIASSAQTARARSGNGTNTSAAS